MNDTSPGPDITARPTLPTGHDFEPATARTDQPVRLIGWTRRCRRCGEEWRWRTYWQRWEQVRESNGRRVNSTGALPYDWLRVPGRISRPAHQ